jgi:glycine oxidase ThiO
MVLDVSKPDSLKLGSVKPEVLILGGGAMGLAIALDLHGRGVRVAIASRNFTEAALHAAAGMLAPQAEQIPPGPMLDLCLASRERYPEWIRKLEQITGTGAGYWATGILAPVYAGLAPQPPPYPNRAATPWQWCDRPELEALQPGLSEQVQGAWWYPKDAQVDNRRLAQCLAQAVEQLGIPRYEGVEIEQLVIQGDRLLGVDTPNGRLEAAHYVLSTGAWSQKLLPIPVQPRKGQLLSLRALAPAPLPLQRVLFGQDIYLVPRQDGRVVVGATNESVGFTPANTAIGVQMLLTEAIRLVPGLAELDLQQTWWGFRPTPPDQLPLLGPSPYANLSLATGHYRNGILLMPITAELIADSIVQGNWLEQWGAFRGDRF